MAAAASNLPIDEVRSIRSAALSYAQANKGESTDLLALAAEFVTFLTDDDQNIRSVRQTAISYAQSNPEEGKTVLVTAKKYADFLEGK